MGALIPVTCEVNTTPALRAIVVFHDVLLLMVHMLITRHRMHLQ